MGDGFSFAKLPNSALAQPALRRHRSSVLVNLLLGEFTPESVGQSYTRGSLDPGTEAGIDGPIASVRLKNLRDGMEDYEYFVLLENRGGGDIVDEIVKSAVPTWGSWDQNTQRLIERRRTLAREILKRGD